MFRTGQLLELLKQAYDQPTWHGANLQDSLKEVGLEEAVWRPSSERHNIWELVLHCAYWKHVVIRWLEGYQDEEGFPRSPKDFPTMPEQTESNWTADLELLETTHQRLLEHVTSFDSERLDSAIAPDKKRTFAELVFGVANHDVYHAGQIQLLKRLHEETRAA